MSTRAASATRITLGIQWHSLMMTEAGKIQGTCWAFGSLEGYKHRWANYAVKNPSDPRDRLGTDQVPGLYGGAQKGSSRMYSSTNTSRCPRALRKDELARLKDNPRLGGFPPTFGKNASVATTP